MHVQIGTPKGLETTGLYDQLINDHSYATALGLVWANIKPLDERMAFSADLHDKSASLSENIPENSKPKKGNWFSFNSLKETVGSFLNDDFKEIDKY